MKILMQNRIDAFDKPGGDTEQMLKTKEQLEVLGLQVDVSLEYHPDLSSYDLVHLFNTTRIHETYVQFLNARRQNKPVVLSPIYHDYSEYNRYHAGTLRGFLYRMFPASFVELMKEAARAVIKYPKQFSILPVLIKPGYVKAQRKVISGVDCLLPQSYMDIEKEAEDFNLNKDSLYYRKVVNGVNFEHFDQDNEQDYFPELKKDSFVLCAARIEPVKNQLLLVRSLKETGLKLLLVGSVNKYHKKYANRVLSELGSMDGDYLGFVSIPELVSLFRKAKVHVLPSWFETCGISSLEAGYGGCNVVSTDRGYVREYLRDFAWYCDPSDMVSIRSATLQAYEADKRTNFAEFIKENYSWQRAATQTLEAYEQVLDKIRSEFDTAESPEIARSKYA